MTEFYEGIPLGVSPAEITAGPDGNLWFTEYAGDAVARITPAGVVTEFFEDIPIGSGPLGIAAGPDGNLWFTQYDAGRIGRITPSGVVTHFDEDDGISADASPRSIVAGPDGKLWFTDTNGRRIGSVTTAGEITEYDVDSGVGGGPQTITVGPDGNLWFTEFANGLGRMTTAGVFTRFAGSYGDQGITSGPDGNLWNTAYFGAIRRINTAGVVTGTFPMPSHVSANSITTGPDGNLWFTDGADDSVGRITPSGDVVIITSGISLGSDPRDITTGPDGNLWFTEQSADQIGRITPSIEPPVVTVGDASAIAPTSAALNGTVDARSLDTAVRFEYGTTTAYGSRTPVQFVFEASARPVAAAVTNLQPSTTYHFRLIALSGGGDAQSADRTFTTPAAPAPPAKPACSNGVDDDRDGFADARDPRCHSDADARSQASYRPLLTTESPVDDPLLVCGAEGLAFTSAELVSRRRRIRLRGVAGAAQAGRNVTILAAGRRVASARVGSGGSFSVTFAAARRSPAGVRYQARLGALRSQTIVAQRRLAGVRLALSGDRIVLSGRSIGRRPRSVELLGREGCGAFTRLATVRLRSDGTFRLTAAASTAVDIATYRVRIAAAGAGGARESTAPRSLALR